MAVLRDSASRYVGRYQVLEYLGSGGMSDVYAALHTGLRKRVALKVLRSSLRQDDDAIERFLREGEYAARVSHPNVVNVHDVGVEEGVPFLVMELLSGETLDQKLAREGTLSVETAIDLLLPIFDAVEHVHRAGVIHRDVKPSNILLARRDDGSVTPKLVDFGVATMNERRMITGALGPIGTPTYMSPEQARGLDPVDSASDQYSLASMLFELLTGHEPYPGNDVDSVLSSVARGRFPMLAESLAHVPKGLDDVLARATAFLPRDRFSSVHEFAEALLPYASRRMREAWRQNGGVLNELSGARPAPTAPAERASRVTMRGRAGQPGVPYVAPHGQKRRRLLMIGIGAMALLLGVAAGLANLSSNPTRASAQIEAAEPERAPGVKRDAAAVAPADIAPSGAALSMPRTRVLLHVEPARASSELDGRPLGKGSLLLPKINDNAVHELRVSAPGYVPRVVLFRSADKDLHVALSPAR